MLKKEKRKVNEKNDDEPAAKLKKTVKSRTDVPEKLNNSENKIVTKKDKLFKDGKKPFKKPFKKGFKKTNETKPPNWSEFKKKKKEVLLNRKQSNNLFPIITKAKKLSEKYRKKTLEGGTEERNNIATELHNLLKGHYAKLVMTHDVARVIQQLLKFGTENIKTDISEELKPVIVQMLQSKYAKYCVRRLLKSGSAEIRSQTIEACYGKAVKLASHAVSADIFNAAFSTWASPLQKTHLLQEFFGDMYKQVKDDSIKHIKDAYQTSPEMKSAILNSTKLNLQRILNKQLFDSHLVHIVIMQFLQECSKEDRLELISWLNSHVVILSNTKEGARVVMMCIWFGTNKNRKVIIKTLKEHVITLCKHEYGYYSIITAIDASDDTLLVSKALLTEILKNASDLAVDEWGRKVLLWLVAPGNSTYFHPVFIKELNEGREKSESKKDAEIRYKEILNYSLNPLLSQITEEPEKWLANSSLAVVTSAVLKAAKGEELKNAFESLTKLIIDVNWKIKQGEKEIFGIEDAGIHMTLKKLIQCDSSTNDNRPKLGSIIVDHLNEDIIKHWIQFNRGCFVLVTIIENNSEEVKNKIKNLLSHKKLHNKLKTPGGKILLKKL